MLPSLSDDLWLMSNYENDHMLVPCQGAWCILIIFSLNKVTHQYCSLYKGTSPTKLKILARRWLLRDIEKRWCVFPRTTGPWVAADTQAIRKYSEHQELHGLERCNELAAGNGKLTQLIIAIDKSLHKKGSWPRRGKLGLNDAGIFQWRL